MLGCYSVVSLAIQKIIPALLLSFQIMQRCWSSDEHQRGTFEQIENELTSMLAEDFRQLPSQIYYQYVPIRDTEIGGVLRDCGLRSGRDIKVKEDMIRSALGGNNHEDTMREGRRFSC